jgi:hypothetical protein
LFKSFISKNCFNFAPVAVIKHSASFCAVRPNYTAAFRFIVNEL